MKEKKNTSKFINIYLLLLIFALGEVVYFSYSRTLIPAFESTLIFPIVSLLSVYFVFCINNSFVAAAAIVFLNEIAGGAEYLHFILILPLLSSLWFVRFFPKAVKSSAAVFPVLAYLQALTVGSILIFQKPTQALIPIESEQKPLLIILCVFIVLFIVSFIILKAKKAFLPSNGKRKNRESEIVFLIFSNLLLLGLYIWYAVRVQNISPIAAASPIVWFIYAICIVYIFRKNGKSLSPKGKKKKAQ